MSAFPNSLRYMPRKPRAAMTLPSFTASRRVLLRRECACGGTPGMDGVCEGCRKKNLHSAATPLDPNTHEFMTARCRHSFGNVRVDTGERTATGVHLNAAQDEGASEEPLGEGPTQGAPIELAPIAGLGEAAEPSQSGGTTQPVAQQRPPLRRQST
jgi:hypothetical protein